MSPQPDQQRAIESTDVDALRVTPTLSIPASELLWRFTASGGPGGQHANTANTKATVTFAIAESPSLTEAQRERLVERLGVEVSATASDERSQLRNRNLALERLRSRLADALRVLPPRRATRPSKASKQRRLDGKAKTAATKAGRKRTRYSSED